MKYSKRVAELFLQKYYIANRNIANVRGTFSLLLGPGVTYRGELWLVKSVISLKKVRLFKMCNRSQQPNGIVVDTDECNLHLGYRPLYAHLCDWLHKIVNLQSLINNWNIAKRRGGLKHSDMFQYASSYDVKDDIKRVIGRETRREHKRLQKASGCKPVHKSKTYSIFKLLTYEGAVVLGKNTKWCISSTVDGERGRASFKEYNTRYDVFVIIDRRTNEKWGVLYSRDRVPEVEYKGGMYIVSSSSERKIIAFNQKDAEIDKKQLFLAISEIAEMGKEEEFLRELFERHPISRERDLLDYQGFNAVSMRYDNQEIDRYGLRNMELR